MNQSQYDDTLRYIHSIGMYSKKKAVDLSKMQYLCSLFGNPQNSFKAVHIAGTNGKGSSTAMLSNIFIELGYRTGKYISPFIERFNERISVNGTDISDNDLVFYANLVREKIESLNLCEDLLPNEFEFVTLTAFVYYEKCRCDIVVLETGLGGRLDPTNVINSPLASVITSVSLDHTEILGDTIEKITAEKCGIIKDNSLTVLYPLNEKTVIEQVISVAKGKNNNTVVIPDISQAEPEIIEETLEHTRFRYKHCDYKINLIGKHQVYNAITVAETVTNLAESGGLGILNKSSVANAIYCGLEKTYFPARFEILSSNPLVIFDGAHNISGIETLSQNIASLLKGKKITLVCGILRDKKPEIALTKILNLPEIDKFVAVPINSVRAINPKELCDIALKYCQNAEYINDINTFPEMFHSIMNDTIGKEDKAIVCFGSLFLAGCIKEIVRSF